VADATCCSVSSVSAKRWLAASLLAEMPEPGILRRSGEMVAYAGLNPSTPWSGTSIDRPTRISKIGNAGLHLASFPLDRRGGAVRTWAAIGGFAAALGPLVGGLLVTVGWRWIFLVNVSIGLIALAIAWWNLPDVSRARRALMRHKQLADQPKTSFSSSTAAMKSLVSSRDLPRGKN
jgi:hypothetical protein